jgi:hypothetical protein
MSRRNVWLSFSEWELITNELFNQKYNQFYLNNHELKEWKKDIQSYIKYGYEEDKAKHCFDRVGIYPAIEQVTSAKAYNVLCREDWRSQDLSYVMDSPICFVGMITNYVDDVDMNTTKEQWEDIRLQMREVMKASSQRYWDTRELAFLYTQVVSNQLVSAGRVSSV